MDGTQIKEFSRNEVVMFSRRGARWVSCVSSVSAPLHEHTVNIHGSGINFHVVLCSKQRKKLQ